MKDQQRDHQREPDECLAEAILRLACSINGLSEQLSQQNNINAVLERIAKAERTIMSAIGDYAARVNTAFDTIGTSVDEIVSAQTGIAGDVTELKRIILELQSNPGPISSEDQALLDAGEAKVNALVTKTTAVATALKDLDAQTEGAPPVVIPPTEPTV